MMRGLLNKYLIAVNTLALALALTASASAQTLTSAPSPATRVNIIIEHDRVRFAAPEAVTSWRLEVFNRAHEPVFDSGLVSEPNLEWPLRDEQGQPLESGLYSYTLTINSQDHEASRTQRGHVIINRAGEDDRIWVTSNSAIGVGAETDDPKLTVIGATDSTLGGASLPGERTRAGQAGTGSGEGEDGSSADPSGSLRASKKGAESISATKDEPLRGVGTPGQVALFTTATMLGDSVITQSQDGSVGIGTSTPSAKLAVSGTVSATQYNINNSRVLSVPGTSNLFVGVNAGAANTTGRDNAFFGTGAGIANTTGFENAFFGTNAGDENTTGSNNAFFGTRSGALNTKGTSNSFFGSLAGFRNTEGGSNVFIGRAAGLDNLTGSGNTYVGNDAGRGSNIGSFNTAIGRNARMGLGFASVSNATAIGANALVERSSSLVLGSIAGVNGASDSVNVGIGTTSPKVRLHVDKGKILVGAAGQGVILKSPNGGVCRELTINDAGAIVLKPLVCP
ncbi:MAG TPA: hypothetical protein VIG62_19290 [Blastocatellia bacterium]|jgi:hypothetical protein